MTDMTQECTSCRRFSSACARRDSDTAEGLASPGCVASPGNARLYALLRFFIMSTYLGGGATAGSIFDTPQSKKMAVNNAGTLQVADLELSVKQQSEIGQYAQHCSARVWLIAGF